MLIHVSGTVQGVGFRPFVHRLAKQFDIQGTVCNTSAGVEIHAEGLPDQLCDFLSALNDSAPVAARILSIHVQSLPLVEFTRFAIQKSDTRARRISDVPADLALCEDCRRELLDPNDRRYRYPFINCTNCGPRFTIIHDLPYDRPFTTMDEFEMCPECRVEYDNPLDRRFHAQPVACSACGPQLRWLENTADGWYERRTDDAITSAAAALRAGGILLLQGIGGFHLAVDAHHEAAVRELRRRKQREDKPLALMFPSVSAIEGCCDVTELEATLLTSARAPIVILRKCPACRVVECVAPSNPYLGCMLPYSPLHVLLLNEVDGPLVMTSANFAEEPIAYRVADALGELRDVADAALVHNRKIHSFADDSIVRVVHESPRVWRRARGFVPEPVRVPMSFNVPVLAFGAQLKNTFAIGRGETVLLSQHLGDLDSERALLEHSRSLDHFLKLFGADIGRAACDMHPDYATTRVAEEWCRGREIPLVRVQHHHAHLAACMAENGVAELCIGLCLDGAGFGPDDTVWGGEVLVGDYRSFERVAHLEYAAMPGGELAEKQPWRMALAWLDECLGDELWSLTLPFLEQAAKAVGEQQLKTLLARPMMDAHYPKTSSAGRLFDAVAALLFYGTRSQYEGQAAMELEWRVESDDGSGYRFDVGEYDGCIVLSPRSMLHELLADITHGEKIGVMAYRFHEGFAQAWAKLCIRIANDRGLQTVALSGGCFQNSFLLTRCEQLIAQRGLRVVSHQHVPTNDGGIALGQACIANMQEIA